MVKLKNFLLKAIPWVIIYSVAVILLVGIRVLGDEQLINVCGGDDELMIICQMDSQASPLASYPLYLLKLLVGVGGTIGKFTSEALLQIGAIIWPSLPLGGAFAGVFLFLLIVMFSVRYLYIKSKRKKEQLKEEQK
jgi:hypothetical protein